MVPPRPATSLVLLGAGHAHVEVLRAFALRPEPGVHLTLIGREPESPYSGMLPGLIRGEYGYDEAHIDLAPLAAAAGSRLLIGEATEIDLARRVVRMAAHPDVPFEVLSVDVGGVPALPDAQGIPVKPIGQFLERLDHLDRTLPDGAPVAVIGGGASGVELALAVAARFGPRFRLTLVSRSAEPLAGAPERARRVARGALVDAGIALASGVSAGAIRDGRLILSDGTTLDAAAALWATGVAGPAFLSRSALPCDDRGCLRVMTTLRSVGDERVFAAGDCAAVEGFALPKSGVWAVRAGPILADNLRRTVRGERLRRWRPQRDALTILGLGNGSAVAWRNGLALAGRPVARWKDRIDRRWMRPYQDPPPPPPRPPARVVEAFAPAPAQVLLRVDGWVFDPFDLGRIAAAHALAPLLAAGLHPVSALASGVAGDWDDSAPLWAGLEAALRPEGCPLAGALHQVSAASLTVTVTAGADVPGAAMVRPRDRLIVTKAQGGWQLLSGSGDRRVHTRWQLAALASMRQPDGAAAELLRRHGASACAAVGTAGLTGAAVAMAETAGLTATIWAERVPMLPGARVPIAADPGQAVPELSGGLLAGVAEPQADACLAALRAAGYAAAVIGVVAPRVAASSGPIVVI